MKMDWRLIEKEQNPVDEFGLGAFLKRLQATVPHDDQGLKGFSFLQEAREMLSFTREIERELLESGATGPLHVGFQNADKLEKEAARYRRLKASGVTVYGFGAGQPDHESTEGLALWSALPERKTSLLEHSCRQVHAPQSTIPTYANARLPILQRL